MEVAVGDEDEGLDVVEFGEDLRDVEEFGEGFEEWGEFIAPL